MSAVATETVYGYNMRPADREGRKSKAHNAKEISRDGVSQQNISDLPRAASYTIISNAKDHDFADRSRPNLRRKHSEPKLVHTPNDVIDEYFGDSSGWTTPEENGTEHRSPVEGARNLVADLQRTLTITKHQNAEMVDEDNRSAASSLISMESSRTGSTNTSISTTTKSRSSLNSNFSRTRKRTSWIMSAPSSRSPSPPRRDAGKHTIESDPDAATSTSGRRRSVFPRRKDSLKPSKEQSVEKVTPTTSDDQSEGKRGLLRKTGSFSGIGRTKSSEKDENGRPPTPKTDRPKVPPLPMSFSTDRLPSLQSSPMSPDRAAPMPRMLHSERPIGGHLVVPKKKDELWNVFRNLDGDFAKFASKSLAFKASTVRTSLLPFLRTYATHPSNRALKPEDLDRRANILNKWWTGLIELLHGRNNQSVSGTDRPVILEGISGIMERPEWRYPPSPFCPLNQQSKGATPHNRSTTSLTSSTSDFLAESVHHNVRNIFVQNLSSQMAFVVDKMSMRNASASLVTFCGKACAYAFMFVPNMADVLIRLWELSLDSIRRVLEGNGIGKFDQVSDATNNILSGFPPALHQLGFSSLMKYMRKLRTSPPLPLGTSNIEWWGKWRERWSGRDSDLFYVFVKHYLILVTDFMPVEPTKSERLCAPGMLAVHAQILVNLDATIHREATPSQKDSTTAGPATTFDDVLADPDAIASALPMPPNNAVRLMAENRLIMLIRDFLSERSSYHPIARRMFAESFNDLLQTATRATSMYDHAACYTLLDFLEEAFILLVRFENVQEGSEPLISYEFWKSVWAKMIDSHNTMTEIRLYAFLYTVWNTVVCDLGWKDDLCFDLLLEPKIFESRFNHWSPMVRTYYMRLLCWRVGRHDGDSSFRNLALLETMLDRLQTTWSHYAFLREQALQSNTVPPPTNPCNPAPNRRLLIMRTDTPINPSGALMSFDGILPKMVNGGTSEVAKRNSTFSNFEIDVRPGSALSNSTFSTSDSEAETRGRSIGGFLRNLMPSKARSKSRGSQRPESRLDSPPVPELPNGGIVRAATDDLSSRNSSPMDQPATAAQLRQHQNFSFKFSLEYVANAKQLPPMRLIPPRLPLAAQQFLMSYSQKANTPPAGPAEPTGDSRAHARYCGRALAEWAVVLGDCHSFFERRKNEGVPSNKLVETPTLGVEVFRRPG